MCSGRRCGRLKRHGKGGLLRLNMRELAYRLLGYSGVTGAARRRNRVYRRVLVYHSVSPTEGRYTRGLAVTVHPDTFERQMVYLKRYYRFHGLQEVGNPDGGSQSEKGAIAVTFDDGFGDNYRFAFPILKTYGIPATVFLVTDALDNRTLLWMHRLAYLVNACGGQAVVEAVEALSGERFRSSDGQPSMRALRERLTCRTPPKDRDELLNSLCEELKTWPEQSVEREGLYLTSAEIKEMTQGGIAFGSHGVTHTALAALSGRAQMDELRRSKRVVEEVAGNECPYFAYPFGEPRHYRPESQALVHQAGYECVVKVGGGWNPAGKAAALDRIKVEEEPLPAFASRIEGISLRSGLRGLRGSPPVQ